MTSSQMQEPTTAMRAIAAAEEMLAAGQGNKITWRAILARIGSGSSTTIMAALSTFWAQQGERKKQQDQALSALSGIPPETAAAFKLALEALFDHGRVVAAREWDAQREALTQAQVAAEQQRQLMLAERDAALTENGSQRTRLMDLEQQIATLNALVQREAAHVVELQCAVDERRHERDGALKQGDELRERIRLDLERSASLEEKYVAQLAQEEKRRLTKEAELQRALGELGTLRTEQSEHRIVHAHLKRDVAEARNQAAALAGEIEHLRKEQTEWVAALRNAEKACAVETMLVAERDKTLATLREELERTRQAGVRPTRNLRGAARLGRKG